MIVDKCGAWIGGELRRALLAPDGYTLVVVDSAQIEARVIAWLAGHATLVESFASGRDVYSEFASKAYRRHVDRKKRPEDKEPGFVGKVCVLGLGYGMGWQKFAGTMLAGAMGGPPVVFDTALAAALGVNVEGFAAGGYGGATNGTRVEGMISRLSGPARLVHCAVAESFVRAYRAENYQIVDLWQDLDYRIAAMVDGREESFGPGGCLATARHALRLPNGMFLRYPGLHRSVDPATGRERGYAYISGRSGKERVHLYGGKLAENIVQALARIVVAEQALWISTRYPVITTTHDEVVCLAPEEKAAAALEFALTEMRRPPVWASTLPLNAEGSAARSYGEAK